MIGDAERARLAELAASESIPTGASEPTWREWVGDVVGRALDSVFKGSLPALGAAAPWIGGVVLLLALVVATLILTRVIATWRRVRPGKDGPVVRSVPIVRAPASRAEVTASLTRGDAAEALRALWWWVAGSVEARGYAHFVPDRTNQELLGEVRRAAPGWERLPALARLTNAVDGLLYAGLPLDVAAVERLLPTADEVVG